MKTVTIPVDFSDEEFNILDHDARRFGYDSIEAYIRMLLLKNGVFKEHPVVEKDKSGKPRITLLPEIRCVYDG